MTAGHTQHRGRLAPLAAAGLLSLAAGCGGGQPAGTPARATSVAEPAGTTGTPGSAPQRQTDPDQSAPTTPTTPTAPAATTVRVGVPSHWVTNRISVGRKLVTTYRGPLSNSRRTSPR